MALLLDTSLRRSFNSIVVRLKVNLSAFNLSPLSSFNSIVVRLKAALMDALVGYFEYSFNSIVVRLKAKLPTEQARTYRGFNSIVVRLKGGQTITLTTAAPAVSIP